MNLLLHNGTYITSEKTEVADILITDGKISNIGTNLIPPSDCILINATDKFIIPGGIDPHVHLHLPNPTGYSSDDFFTGTRAALYGGTTTVIDFVTPHKGQSLVDALALRKLEAQNALTDYSFHVSPIDWHKNIEEEILTCKQLGITSFKVYLAYLQSIGLDKKVFFNVLKTVGEIGGLVNIHCEMGLEIDVLRDQFFERNQVEPLYHPLSRPNLLEAEAVKIAIDLADEAQCPIYIVHVSAKESVEYIREAQQKGQKVWGETCPQYLLLDDSRYEGDFEQTASFVLSPPLRKKEDQEALWKALADGTIKTIGTDHCPFMFFQKEAGKNDFRKIPNGAGGIEHRLALTYTYGVLTHKISLNKWVDLCATQPAKAFGLYPKKGEIAIGSDADLVIWNPEIEKEISVKTHHQICDSNIFDGFKTKGNVEYIIKNGEIILENDQIIAAPPHGKFLKR